MGLIHNRCRWNANHANLCERISSHSMRTCTVYTPVWNIAMENDQFATGQFLYIAMDSAGPQMVYCKPPHGLLIWLLLLKNVPQLHNFTTCAASFMFAGEPQFWWAHLLFLGWTTFMFDGKTRILQDETTIFIHVHPFSHHSSGWNQHCSTIFSIIPPCIHHVSIIFHDKNWWLAI